MNRWIYIIEEGNREEENRICGGQTENRLREAGFCIVRYTAAELKEMADEKKEPSQVQVQPDMLILDVDEKNEAEIKALLELVRTFGRLPYPVVAAYGSPSQEGLLAAFSSGANDYVSRNASWAEWLARIQNLTGLFQRINRDGSAIIRYEDLYVEHKTRKVYRGDAEIALTPKEYDLLVYMARRPGEICSREELLQEVWGYGFDVKTNVVDVYIRHIRSKLDAGRRRKLVHTARGVGYMLQ